MSALSSGRKPPAGRRRLLALVRHVHLYLGLVLLPWVILIGISGLAFNRSGVATGRTFRATGAAAFAGTPLAMGLDTDALANRALEALRRALEAQGAEASGLARLECTPRLRGSFRIEAFEGRVPHRLDLDPMARGATLRISPVPTLPDRYAAVSRLDLGDTVRAPVRATAGTLLERLGVRPDAPLKLGKGPVLDVPFRLGDFHGELQVELVGGEVRIRDLDQRVPLSHRLRELAVRAHMLHGKRPWWDAHQVQVVFAELLALAMVFWGLSGVVMWWQRKGTRRTGAALLVGGFSVALPLALVLAENLGI